jgi:hypothetical protein
MYKRSLFSISELAQEFQCDRRTISGKLANVSSDGTGPTGHPTFFLSTAIQAVYGGETSVREEIDRERLKTLVDERKAREGTLVELANVEKTMMQTASIIRTGTLTLPKKLAPLVARCRTIEEAEEVIRREVYSVLRALAAWDLKENAA